VLKPLRVVFEVLLVVLFVGPAFAQTVDTAWVRMYNGPANSADEVCAMAVDDSGNVYVTGLSFNETDYKDWLTIKYLPNGDTAWVRRYDESAGDNDETRAVAVDDSGNVYVTGRSDGCWGNADFLTMKYGPDGATAWKTRYDGPGNGFDAAQAIGVDGSGNVYVTGSGFGLGTDYDIVTAGYLSNGDVWLRTYNGPGNARDQANSIAVDGAGNIYVAGYCAGSGTDDDFATIKYLPNGDTAWVRRYNGPGNGEDWANAVAVDGDGNVYVTGHSLGDGTDYDYATIKYLPDGDTAWVRRNNGPGNGQDFANAVAVDGDGNVYVTGESSGDGTDYDYATIKYLPDGDTAWVRRYNGPGNGQDFAKAVALDGDGNVYVTGESIGDGTSFDFTTIKYLANGDSGWVMRYDGPESDVDEAVAIAVDDSGNVYVTGSTTQGGKGVEDYCTIKYVQTPSEVKDETGDRERPSEFDLSQNYPNPFNPATKIEFTLAKPGFVTLQVYDVLGRKVRTLVSEELSSGYKSVIWDGKNDAGDDVASAVYFYQLKVGDFSEPKKMLLLK
jgi:uncharacterized delta-60 repeat protein